MSHVTPEEIDIHEQIAMDLEHAQTQRFIRVKMRDDFWDEKELNIHEIILFARKVSKTYHPDNER